MGTADRIPTIPELDRMKSLVWRAMADGAVGFLDRPPVRARHLCQGPGDPRARAHRRQRRRRVRVPHAERGHRARGRDRGNHPGGAGDRGAGPDLAPQGGQPEPLGRQHEGARPDRRRPRAWPPRRGRPVCLHRRELDAGDPLPGVGARRRPGEDGGAPERSRDVGAHQVGDGGAARRARPDRPLVRRRRLGAIGRGR